MKRTILLTLLLAFNGSLNAQSTGTTTPQVAPPQLRPFFTAATPVTNGLAVGSYGNNGVTAAMQLQFAGAIPKGITNVIVDADQSPLTGATFNIADASNKIIGTIPGIDYIIEIVPAATILNKAVLICTPNTISDQSKCVGGPLTITGTTLSFSFAADAIAAANGTTVNLSVLLPGIQGGVYPPDYTAYAVPSFARVTVNPGGLVVNAPGDDTVSFLVTFESLAQEGALSMTVSSSGVDLTPLLNITSDPTLTMLASLTIGNLVPDPQSLYPLGSTYRFTLPKSAMPSNKLAATVVTGNGIASAATQFRVRQTVEPPPPLPVAQVQQ